MDRKVPSKTSVGLPGPREKNLAEVTQVPDARPRTPSGDRSQMASPLRGRTASATDGLSTTSTSQDKVRPESQEAKLAERRLREEALLRRPESLDRIIQKLPPKAPVRQLLEAFADSFFFQLVAALTLTVSLVLVLHFLDPTARYCGPLLYIYFLLASLHFARFRPHLAILAALAFILTGVILFTISVGASGTTIPLLAFRPTILFWLSIGVVTTFATILINQHTDSLVDSRLAFFALQRQLRDRDEASGRTMREGKIEETFSIAKQAENERREVVKHYSSLFLYMQKLAQNLQPIELVTAVWGILKHGIQATSCEIYALKNDHLELTQAFRIASDSNTESSPLDSPEERAAKGSELVPLSTCPHHTIPLESDGSGLLAYVVSTRRSVFFEDIARDPTLQALATHSPVPVAYAYPIIDVKNNTVKGVINVSQCRRTRLTDEERQILRTTADLSAMSISHWETLEAERGAKLALRKQFATYVSPAVVQEIMDRPDLVEPRRQKMTVMFVDLRGFTNLSEANPPHVVVALLADFFGRLTPLIFEHHGTLDKYIGDEIMALWGAPAFTPYDARRAVLASWCMREAFIEVKDKWAPRLGRPVEIGIAINTGEAMVGSIGSETLKNYTAIGDAVNTAARLEGVTGAGRIQITRATYEEVKDMIEGEWQVPVRVQGKAEPLEMFLVTDIHRELVDTLPTRDASTASEEKGRIMSSRDLARQVRSGFKASPAAVTTTPALTTTSVTATGPAVSKTTTTPAAATVPAAASPPTSATVPAAATALVRPPTHVRTESRIGGDSLPSTSPLPPLSRSPGRSRPTAAPEGLPQAPKLPSGPPITDDNITRSNDPGRVSNKGRSAFSNLKKTGTSPTIADPARRNTEPTSTDPGQNRKPDKDLSGDP